MLSVGVRLSDHRYPSWGIPDLKILFRFITINCNHFLLRIIKLTLGYILQVYYPLLAFKKSNDRFYELCQYNAHTLFNYMGLFILIWNESNRELTTKCFKICHSITSLSLKTLFPYSPRPLK